MEITELDLGDRDAVGRYVDLANAVRAADAPWSHPLTVRECEGLLRHHWEGEPPRAFLASIGADPVAAGRFYTSSYDNLGLAWLDLEVHPRFRRRGCGSEVLAFLLDLTKESGRTSIGIDGWESEAARRFAARHGFEVKSHEINRRQHLAELDPSALERVYDDASPRAAAYELVRWPRRTPDAELQAVATMVAAINDAPTDDLEIEDEVFTPERVRAYEDAHVRRDIAIHRLVARHRETGELAGQTVVGVDGERPQLAEQHDTSVVRAHRGHRLGLVLKIEMLRWLREEQPQIESIDTWNAESNDHMIGVNAVLGYRVMGRALAFQRRL